MGYYRSDATGKLTKYAGSNNRGYMPLGMIFASSVELEELTVKCLNGQNLSINGSYNQFCYWLMDQGSKAPTCDIATYASEMASYGQCGKYVINNTATAQTSGNYTVPAYSIKLPTITEFVASNNGGDAIGLAELDMFKSHEHSGRGGTAFINSNIHITDTTGTDAWAGSQAYSSTNPTGGEETRPKNIRYPYYVVVAQGVRLQALVDMEKKAEKDASNLTEPDVESWQEKLNTSRLVYSEKFTSAKNSFTINQKFEPGVYKININGTVNSGSDVYAYVNSNRNPISYNAALSSYNDTAATSSNTRTDSGIYIGISQRTMSNISITMTVEEDSVFMESNCIAYDPGGTTYARRLLGFTPSTGTVNNILIAITTSSSNTFNVGSTVTIYKLA